MLSSHTHPLIFLSFSGIKFRGSQIKKMGTNFYLHRAVEKDSEFEIDPDKAREALRKLDQQLQSLSQKKIDPPKIRAAPPDLSRARVEMTEVPPEFSGSFLAYSAFVLLVFTIFYNVLFFTVIQPSVDTPQQGPVTTSIQEASETMLSQNLPKLQE